MTRYVVLTPGNTARPDSATFVADRFRWLALIFPLIWLLVHRLWLASAAYFIAVGALTLAGRLTGEMLAAQLAVLTLGLAVALEGPAWRIAKLRRRGFRESATLYADSLEEAEIQYFSNLPAPIVPESAVDNSHLRRMAAKSLLDVPGA
ncbi:DUF2628 domain-containing protein [Aureimonas fodinaquatilis]|uniref:DUF2628 domain-containing protein n=1 Tax=Aureimonas fodinaquatilis TaxID=2565783 RepID=A0A5B0DPQ3_9HYPH|nr:DUF2628 domain-containing protein [Aureimonas fodinaquatilis]KAA0968456.1 DUF2628 domain-containing protein [Aureimonas fodinaquatilis]